MEKPFTFKAYDFNLTAGGSQAILAGGEYFRILSSTGALDVTVEGKGTMPDLQAGQAIKGLPFNRLILSDKTGAPNSGFILVASSELQDNRLQGSVTVTNVSGAFTQNNKTVTNASAQLLAANPARRYLLIQNNDAAGIIYVTMDGTPATTAKGIKIAAGGSYECQGYVPTGELRAIGSISSNANIVAVEG